MNETVEVNDENMDEFLKDYAVALVDFWASWCGPCKMMEPVLEDFAREMDGKVTVGKLDVDKNPENTNKYEVSTIPTLIVFKEGEEVDRLIGAMPLDELMNRVKKHL